MKLAQSFRCLVWVVGIALIAAPAAAQDEEKPSAADLEQAKAAFAKGKELFDKGELLDAAKSFKKSYRLSKNPILLYNIGFTTDKLGRLDLAIFYYEKFLDEAPEAAPNRDTAEKRLKVLKEEKEKADATPKVVEKPDEPKETKPPVKAEVTTTGDDGFQHNIIEEAPPGKPLDVTAFVPKGSNWQVVLYYRLPGAEKYKRVLMRPRYAELVGRISASDTSKASSIQYYVEARAGREIVARSGKPTSPHLISIDESAKARFYPDLSEHADFTESRTSHQDDRQRSKYFWHKWGSAGGAAAMLTLSISFYLISSDAAGTLEGEASASSTTDACPDKPCRSYSKVQDDLQSRGKRFETLGHVTLGLGVAAAAAFGTFWYLERKAEKKGSGSGGGEKHYNPDDESPIASRLQVAPMLGSDFVGGAARIEF